MKTIDVVALTFIVLAIAAFGVSLGWLMSSDILIDRQHGILAAIAGGVFANVAMTAVTRKPYA